jgi:hypothetical protein
LLFFEKGFDKMEIETCLESYEKDLPFHSDEKDQ